MQAPYRAIEAVEAAAKLPFEEGVKKEAELFRDCLFSERIEVADSRLLRRADGREIPDLPNDIKPIDVRECRRDRRRHDGRRHRDDLRECRHPRRP